MDAVVIATPDHWHALMFIDACDAGKDVYVEKPLSLTVAEGRKMVETADRTKRVVQVGIQRRSAKFLQEAAEFVRSGGIGHVTVAKGYHVYNEWPNGIGASRTAPPPTDLTGINGWGRRRRFRTTATGRFTISAGSTTTRADRSPISASIIWTCSGGASGRTRPMR